jgi:hypothetical protein
MGVSADGRREWLGINDALLVSSSPRVVKSTGDNFPDGGGSLQRAWLRSPAIQVW